MEMYRGGGRAEWNVSDALRQTEERRQEKGKEVYASNYEYGEPLNPLDDTPNLRATRRWSL